MAQFRPQYNEEMFIKQVLRQQKAGYSLAYLEEATKILSIAGFRITEDLSSGKFLYVDDLVTDAENRSKGYGSKLFDWLVTYAKENDCKSIQLNSRVQRFDAHRFYFRKGLSIYSYHFGIPLEEPTND